MQIFIEFGNNCQYSDGTITFYDGLNLSLPEKDNLVTIGARKKDYFFLCELKKATERAINDIHPS